MSLALTAWRTASRLPLGDRLFSLGMSIHVPYFGSVRPHVLELAPGRCRVRIADRWRVHNHLGTVHAIAQCNAAEIAMGMAVDASVPPTHRWIPIGMTVEYRAKARGTLTATAAFDPPVWPGHATDHTVNVEIEDARGMITSHARITVRVEPRPARS
jgi:acyl-coenzyme A thioesterase PaaI-like protein